MNKEQYMQRRGELMAQAEALVQEGKLEEFTQKKAEIEQLDADYEAAAKARADIQALNMGTRVTDITALGVPDDGTPAFARMGEAEAEPDSIYNSTKYRRAFMNRVILGTPIPNEFRNADETTYTTDVESVIPPITINRIIEKIETTGMVLPLVTRTSYKAGINIPTASVKPVATWIAEGGTSDRKKKGTGVITLTNHKLRCEIALTMETHVMALDIFEAVFVRQVAEAMIKAIEGKILSDDPGTGCPRGILAETPEPGQAIKANELTYQLLIDAESALPQAYEAGARYFMSKKTFMGYMSMTDDTGQPIARVTYGIGGSPERTLLGRSVVLTGDYMPSFSDDLDDGKIFAFLLNPSDYMFNTVYDMGIQRKQDWDNEDHLIKAVMSVDGRLIDKRSLVTIAKKA